MYLKLKLKQKLIKLGIFGAQQEGICTNPKIVLFFLRDIIALRRIGRRVRLITKSISKRLEERKDVLCKGEEILKV